MGGCAELFGGGQLFMWCRLVKTKKKKTPRDARMFPRGWAVLRGTPEGRRARGMPAGGIRVPGERAAVEKREGIISRKDS